MFVFLRLSLLLLMATCFFAVQGQSQKSTVSRPSLDGEWHLDKSKEPEDSVGQLTLLIKHNDPELRINRVFKSKLYTREENLAYYTDERGEENIDNGDKVKSKTKWEGRSIVSTSSAMARSGGDRFDRFRTDKWQISEDGNSLKQTITYRLTTSNAVRGVTQPRKTTHTFVRVP